MVDKAKKVGVVTHYYSGIGVGTIKVEDEMKLGDKLHFKGSTTDFSQLISEMQFDHKPIEVAKKGQEIGVKISGKVREGDEVFLEA